MITHRGLSAVSYDPAAVTEPVDKDDTDFRLHMNIAAGVTQYDDWFDSALQEAREFAEEELRMSLVSRSWDLVLDRYPKDFIALPFGPVTGVTTFTYIDQDGTATTTFSDYFEDLLSVPARLCLNDTATWPEPIRNLAGIRIRYAAGYTNLAEATKPKKYIRKAIMKYVALQFESERDGFSMTEDPRYRSIVNFLQKYAQHY